MHVNSLIVDFGLAALRSTVTAATNASPVVVTTSGAHGLTSGDRVSVFGMVTLTSPNNAAWTVNVLSPTTFELTGSVGNGVWASGGTIIKAIPLGVAPAAADIINFETNATDFNLGVVLGTAALNSFATPFAAGAGIIFRGVSAIYGQKIKADGGGNPLPLSEYYVYATAVATGPAPGAFLSWWVK